MKELTKLKKTIEIKTWLDNMKVKNYTINKDLTVDVDNQVNISFKGLKNIPVKFRKVQGYFDCQNNKLTSLKGCPDIVKGYFVCHTNRLTSLEGCPEEVGGVFGFSDNNISTLEYFPRVIKKGIFCSMNLLTTLEHAPKEPNHHSLPCSPIYDRLGWIEDAHKECRKVWI